MMCNIFCLLESEEEPFSFDIDQTQTVDDLKKELKKEGPSTLESNPTPSGSITSISNTIDPTSVSRMSTRCSKV
jgi:hypothetical protein